MITDRKKGFLQIAVLLLAASLLGGQTLCLSPRAEATPSDASRTGSTATGSDAAVSSADPSIDPETGYLEDGEVMFDLTTASDLATGSDALSEMKAAGMLAAAPLLRDSGATFKVERYLMKADGTYGKDPTTEGTAPVDKTWAFQNDQPGYVLDKYNVVYYLEDATGGEGFAEVLNVQEGEGLKDGSGNPIYESSVITLSIYYKKQTVPVFHGHGMKLTDKIDVRFRIKVPEGFDVSGAHMDFSVESGRTSSVAYADGENDTGDVNAKWFTCYINALELNDEITATFHYGNNESVQDHYKACKYITDAKTLYPNDQNLKKLLNALQNYGAYLQLSKWTDGKNHQTIDVSEGISVQKVEEVRGLVSNKIPEKITDNSGIEDIKYSLTLNSDTRINAFFKPASGVSITTQGGKAVTVGDAVYYQFRSERINVLGLEDIREIPVATNQGTASLKASALSYVYTVLNSDANAVTDDQKCAMAAYYYYYDAAKGYSGNGTN